MLFGIVLFLLLINTVSAIDCNFKAENMEKILIPLDQDLICEGTAITFNNITGGVLDCQNFSLEGKVFIQDSKDFEIINCDLTKDQLIINNLNNSKNEITQSIKQDLKKNIKETNISEKKINESKINKSTYETNKKIVDKSYSLFWLLLVLIILLLLIIYVVIYFKKNN